MKSRLKDRRKDIVKLLAALHLRDAYAMRKLVRRIVPVFVIAAFVTTASPSWAKKITDEELAAFLGRPVTSSSAETKAAVKVEAPVVKEAAPKETAAVSEKVSDVKVTAEEKPVSVFASKEGELKTVAPKESPKGAVKKKRVVELPAVDPAEEKAESQTLALEGEVSGKNNYGIAVTFAMDETKGEAQESWFNLTKATKLSGFKDLSDLGEGDRVGVVYKKLVGTDKKLPQKITLIQRKPPEPAVVAAPEGI